MTSLLLLFGVFFGLLILGTPILFSLLAAGLVVLASVDLLSPQLALQRVYAGLDSFPMLAIPFFMAAGALMERGGISRRLVNFSSYLVGWVRGGLGHVAVIASTFFAGISGSAVADTTAIGSTMIPMMKRRGFDPAFAASVVAAAGVNGPVIPPSIPLVLYGVISGVSIGALFMGGIVPGLLMTVGLMILIYVKASRGGLGHRDRAVQPAGPGPVLPVGDGRAGHAAHHRGRHPGRHLHRDGGRRRRHRLRAAGGAGHLPRIAPVRTARPPARGGAEHRDGHGDRGRGQPGGLRPDHRADPPGPVGLPAGSTWPTR